MRSVHPFLDGTLTVTFPDSTPCHHLSDAEHAACDRDLTLAMTGGLLNSRPDEPESSMNLPVDHFALRGSESLGTFIEYGNLSLGRSLHDFNTHSAIWRRRCGSLPHTLFVGTGGSYFAAKTLADWAEGVRGTQNSAFLHSPDPSLVASALSTIRPRETALLVTSKSGATTEILLLARAALSWLKAAGVTDACNRMTLVTAQPTLPESVLALQTEFGGSIHLWPMHECTGGRFGITGGPGAAACAALGLDFAALLAGANAADADSARRESAARAYAAALCSVSSTNTTAPPQDDQLCTAPAEQQVTEFEQIILTYSGSFGGLARQLQQYYMESLGKTALHPAARTRRTAATTLAGVGPFEQHNIMQQVLDGPRQRRIVSFLRCNNHAGGAARARAHGLANDVVDQLSKMQAAHFAGATGACAARGVPSMVLEMPRGGIYELGALASFHENVILCVGAIWGINAFDQPGVKLGKDLASAKLLEDASRPVMPAKHMVELDSPVVQEIEDL